MRRLQAGKLICRDTHSKLMKTLTFYPDLLSLPPASLRWFNPHVETALNECCLASIQNRQAHQQTLDVHVYHIGTINLLDSRGGEKACECRSTF